MSSTVSWSVHTRRVMLAVIGLASVGAAVGAQFAPVEVLDVRSASTAQLAGVLGLLVLPLVTVGAVLADRRFLGRHRSQRGGRVESETAIGRIEQPSGRAVESAQEVTLFRPVLTASPTMPALSVVPVIPGVAGASNEKPSSVVHPGGPRTSVVGGVARAATAGGPRIEVVIENKPPRPQIVTVYAPVRGGAVRSKTAA
jgi:hypothetical protein